MQTGGVSLTCQKIAPKTSIREVKKFLADIPVLSLLTGATDASPVSEVV